MERRINLGDFLIADPSILGDTHFHRSVILICAVQDESPMGFIVNKPFHFSLTEVLPEIDKDLPLFYGGPVDVDQLFFIYRANDALFEGSRAISDQLYFGGDVDAALDTIETGQLNKRNSRFFLGYSGWSKGQLEEEINMESWAIQSSSSSSSFLEANTKELWRNALINMGGDYRIWADTPENPNYN